MPRTQGPINTGERIETTTSSSPSSKYEKFCTQFSETPFEKPLCRKVVAMAYDLDYSDDSTSESTSESLSEPCSLDDDNNNHNTLQGQHVSLEGVEEQKHIIISVNERLDALQNKANEMQAQWLQMVKDIRAWRRQEQEKHRLEMKEATAKIQELERLLAIAGWNAVD